MLLTEHFQEQGTALPGVEMGAAAQPNHPQPPRREGQALWKGSKAARKEEVKDAKAVGKNGAFHERGDEKTSQTSGGEAAAKQNKTKPNQTTHARTHSHTHSFCGRNS